MSNEINLANVNSILVIHGNWSDWQVTLDNETHIGKIRSCDNPNPLYGGDQCSGPDHEVKEKGKF